MKTITLEEAKRLNEIGIDPNTADLWYYESASDHRDYINVEDE